MISLQKAFLCVNCDVIGDSSRNCPVCASTAILSLAGVLNREVCTVPDSLVEAINSLDTMYAGGSKRTHRDIPLTK